VLSPPGDPVEALRLRRGERLLWQGRPGLRLGIGPERWRRAFVIVGLLLGAVFMASLTPALDGRVDWSEAIQNGAGWVATLTPLVAWGAALWWVRRISGSGGCAISILAVCVPLVVGVWLFQAISQPKHLPKLLLHPLFLVGAGASCLCAASVARSLMSEQGARYFATTRRAAEVRHSGGEWRISWSSVFKVGRPLAIRAVVAEGAEVGDLRVGRGHRFSRIAQPKTLQEDLERALAEAAEEGPPPGPEPKASLEELLPEGTPARIALPSELSSAIRLRSGEEALWTGAPGLRLPTREIRSLLRGSVSVAGVMFAGWLVLLAPALAALDPSAGLALLGVVAIWVGALVGFVSLTLVIQRLVTGGALASGAFLFSAGILSLALLEAISRGKILRLVLDPTAQVIAVIGALGLGWIMKEILALRRQRYVLTTRRAAALRDGGRSLLWSVALGGDLRGIRSIYPSESKARGHVVFGFGQSRNEFRFVEGVEEIVVLGRQAIRERREAFPEEFELIPEEDEVPDDESEAAQEPEQTLEPEPELEAAEESESPAASDELDETSTPTPERPAEVPDPPEPGSHASHEDAS
jgi:hypothetical protein